MVMRPVCARSVVRDPRAGVCMAKLGIGNRSAAGVGVPQNQARKVPTALIGATRAVAKRDEGQARGNLHGFP
jgi:hypothetical protein